MRIAILSAGPSLQQTFTPDEQFDLRIGVNAAATLYPVDWWSCGDAQNFSELVAVGLPVLFTITDSDSWFQKDHATADRLTLHRMVLWGEVATRNNPPQGTTTWSITAALLLAVDLGATSVDVFGHDMDGAVDVAGRFIVRRPGNYPRMTEDWKATRAWAEGKGVRVHEHKP